MSENPFEQFIKDYKNDPVRFTTEVLGIKPLFYQAELLNAVASGERRCSVRSGHGTGKSSSTSWLMLWFLLTKYPCKVVVTAPTSSQLFDALFAETKRWVNEMPQALKELLIVKSDRIELAAAPSEAFISCRVSRPENSGESLAGVHSDNVLLIADEASAVPEKVFESAGGSMSGHNACTILLSNPTRTTGTFYQTQTEMSDKWWVRKWSCIDSPLVSQDFIDEMAERYGLESAAYSVRVLGEFPKGEDDTVIPLHLVESATQRDIKESDNTTNIWGVDVARYGDNSVIAKRSGTVITEIKVLKNLDLMQLMGAIKNEYDSLHPTEKPENIYIDSIGMGMAIVDRGQELGLPVIGINVSEASSMKQQYLNLRAELWFNLKQFLENRDCKIPKDEKLIQKMLAPRYSYTSSGKIKIESKEDMKRRGVSSPDRADAVCLCLARDNVIALKGGKQQNWNKPIRRNMRGIV